MTTAWLWPTDDRRPDPESGGWPNCDIWTRLVTIWREGGGVNPTRSAGLK
jgi:hypothetical protein